VETWEQYLSLFAAAYVERIVGEGSVAYLGSERAACLIAERFPRALILMVLRDPADRLWAHYRAAYAAGARCSFGSWLDAELAREAGQSTKLGTVWSGRYATHLARFRTLFPDAQIHITWFERYRASPQTALRSIFEFMGVNELTPIDCNARYNVTTVPRWPALGMLRGGARSMLRSALRGRMFDRVRAWSRVPLLLAMPAAERARAVALYRDEIEALADATGRDLSAWLS
jgi:hypothetical protein